MIIEKHLYWHKHIKQLRDKIAKQCGILYLTRDLLNKKSLILIYYSLIYSNLIYCQTVWGGASNSALSPLNIIQKRVMRTIEGLKKRDHTNDAFYKHTILKLTDINVFHCATFVYKSLHNLTSNNYFTRNLNDRYPTRSGSNLHVPFMSSSQSQTNIRYQGPRIYNCLPDDIKNKPTVYSFKSSLKRHLISRYST